jgi:hypothetical protein
LHTKPLLKLAGATGAGRLGALGTDWLIGVDLTGGADTTSIGAMPYAVGRGAGPAGIRGPSGIDLVALASEASFSGLLGPCWNLLTSVDSTDGIDIACGTNLVVPPATTYGCDEKLALPPATTYGLDEKFALPPATTYGCDEKLALPPATTYGCDEKLALPPATTYGCDEKLALPPATIGSVDIFTLPPCTTGAEAKVATGKVLAVGAKRVEDTTGVEVATTGA